LTAEESQRIEDAFGSEGRCVHDWNAMFAAVGEIVAARVGKAVSEQREIDLAMHRAYRPEVVAEVAVHLGSHEDWDEIVRWCGGRIETNQDPSGEYVSCLVLPNGEAGSEQSWLVLTHDGEFHIRAEVQAPAQIVRG